MMHVICIVGYQHAIEMHTVLREWSSIHDATIHSRKLKKALFKIKLKAKVSFVIGFVLTTATVVIDSYYFIQDSLLFVILDRDNYLTRGKPFQNQQ